MLPRRDILFRNKIFRAELDNELLKHDIYNIEY